MQSKEEIEKDKKRLKSISESFTYSMWSENTEALRRMLNYIENLETEKQKLIYDLEGAIDLTRTGKDIISRAKVECLENVLKILKGEKQ